MLENLLLPAGDRLLGHPMMKRLRFLREAQWWDWERLEAERNRLLESLIAVAYRDVPFYRGLMDSAGIGPADIRRGEDLRKLPVVSKCMLRAAYPAAATRDTSQRTYEARTSGSTGANFTVLEDNETAGWYRASFLLALEWSGWRIGSPHVQTGMTLRRDSPRRLKDLFLRCHYFSAADLTDAALDRGLQTIQEHSIRHLWGYPGSLHCLARRARQTGVGIQLKSLVSWGDMLHASHRREIEDAFQAKVFDTYGCGEGIQIAAQCGHGENYHIHALDVIVEFLDDDGQPVRAGQRGNLVVTRLHPGPMPLIRYAVGDAGIAGQEGPCGCGRALPGLTSIEGRMTDVVRTPSGNRLVVHYFTAILEHFAEIESFQVRQDSPESIRLLVVPSRTFGENTAGRIVAALQQHGNADLAIEVEKVESIPLTSGGKRRFIISSLETQAR
jgi:phenylacetate-CoA ligase